MNTTTSASDQPVAGIDPAASRPSQDAAAPAPADDQASSSSVEGADSEGDEGIAPAEASGEASAERPEKRVRARRGPPADGKEEPRKIVILTTSKLTDAEGGKLRRGQAVSVPVRRLETLERSGKIRKAPKNEIEAAERRFGLGRIG
jgi:hypothetical protein